MTKFWVITVLCLVSPTLHAHVGPPTVKRIEFPGRVHEDPHISIENLGLFAPTDSGYMWLCDEALIPYPGLNDVRFLPTAQRYLVASRTGLYHSRQPACEFLAQGGELSEHVIGRILSLGGENVILGTQTLGRKNDLFVSKDSGQSWAAVGLEFQGRIRSMVQSDTEKQVVYVVHSEGGVRSDDGGRTFTSIDLTLNGESVPAVELNLLAVSPSDSDTVYAARSDFPKAALLRSTDGGQTWRQLLELQDVPDSLVIDEPNNRLMIASPLDGILVSNDLGAGWQSLARPKTNLWMGCLTIGPQNTVWACVRDDPDWLVVRSGDWGQNWTVALSTHLHEVASGFDCASNTPARSACGYTCEQYPMACNQPGDSMSATPIGGMSNTRPQTSAEQSDTTKTPSASMSDGGHSSGCQSIPTSQWALFFFPVIAFFSIRRFNQKR